MPTSKASSTPPRTSSPTELDLARAIGAEGFPLWANEPLHALLAEQLGAPPRLVRERLAALALATRIDGGLFGALDETWLYRLDVQAKDSLATRLARVEGVAAWTAFAEGLAVVRTIARDAVERERRLRALHRALGERPLHQLERPHTPTPRRKYARMDWDILLALRRTPWTPVEALADAAGVSLRIAKERVGKLAAERAARIEARPVTLVHVVVRLAPSSTAAARACLARLDGLLCAWVPPEGEASLVDATLAADAPLDAAREVPGVASVELLHPVASWEGDAIGALLDDARSRASRT